MEFLLLDDQENLKLAIIRKLEQQYSFSERKDRLCKQLAISPYLLERNITEINADLQRFGLINEMEISEKIMKFCYLKAFVFLQVLLKNII